MKGLLRVILHCCTSAPVEESVEEGSEEREVPVLPQVQRLPEIEENKAELSVPVLHTPLAVDQHLNQSKPRLPHIFIVPPGQGIRTVLFSGGTEPERPRQKKKRKTDKGARKQPSQT